VLCPDYLKLWHPPTIGLQIDQTENRAEPVGVNLSVAEDKQPLGGSLSNPIPRAPVCTTVPSPHPNLAHALPRDGCSWPDNGGLIYLISCT